MKVVIRLEYLLIAATILSGLLAGASIDRFVVGFPAWKHVNISAWAEYSRHADLGNGIFVYPVEAIGSFLLLLISSFIVLKNKKAPVHQLISFQIYLAALLAFSGLLLTFFAGPFMLSIKNMNDPFFLQHAFDEFYYWSIFRGIAQVLSFLACMWALGKIFDFAITNLQSTD